MQASRKSTELDNSFAMKRCELRLSDGLGPGGLTILTLNYPVNGQCIPGSSHGGKAQYKSNFINAGPPYDVNKTKSLLGGSGGSCLHSSGSVAGGGAIELVAEKGEITINASIIASAQTANSLSYCSGGSGGLIRLKAQKVQIQEKGRLNVEGGNGQQPSNAYDLGGGAGGIIQIIAPEGSLAANTLSKKRGENSGAVPSCVAEDGYFLLKVNETASPASVNLTLPYSWPPTSSNSGAVATTPLATSTATESILTTRPSYASTTEPPLQPSVSPTPGLTIKKQLNQLMKDVQFIKYKSDEESHSESEFYYPEQDEQVKTEKNNMANVATHGDENSSNSPEELQMFVQEQKSENTVKKTTSDVKCFYRFLGSINKRNVQILDLPPEELDHLLEKFFKDVRKVSGDEYEPSTLTGLQRSEATDLTKWSQTLHSSLLYDTGTA
ncbi:hypothetical protein ACROYT_G013688 [Oculina patagonica]